MVLDTLLAVVFKKYNILRTKHVMNICKDCGFARATTYQMPVGLQAERHLTNV